MNQSRKNTLKRSAVFLVFYTVLFLICSAVAFCCFYISGKTLISSDGLRQHYVAFIYFGKYVRELVKGIVVSKSLTIPSFSFGIGFGGDILQTLNYYVIGDPLNLISVIVPIRFARRAYEFLIIFRLWLAGLSFSLFCAHKGVKSRAGILTGALCYVLATYSLNFGTMHPFFLNPMIYLPLLLFGVDLVIEKKRPYLLAVIVFISAISNFYFFYMLVIVTVVYSLVRLFVLYKKSFKDIFSALVRIAVPSAVGLLMSSAILIPVAIAFLSDTRGGAKLSLPILYSIGVYLRFPSSLIVSNSVLKASQTLLGYSSISIPVLAVLFTKKKKNTAEKALFVISTVLLLLPITALVMNGFSYPANRWVWAYAMVISYVIASEWGYIMSLSLKQKLTVAITSVVYIAVVLITSKNIMIDVLIACSCMLIFALVLSTDINKTVKSIIGVSLAVVTICANSFLYFDSEENQQFIEKFADAQYIEDEFTKTYGKSVRNASDDLSFYRYTHNTDGADYNRDMIFDTNGTSFYWSIQNPNISQFLAEMEMPYTFLYQYQNLDRRTQLNSLLGVKYYSEKFSGRLPYGYDVVSRNVLNDNDLFVNNYSLPIVLSYSDYITREDYDSLNAVDKQNAIMSSVLLENDVDGFEKVKPDTTSTSLDYRVFATKGIEVNGDEIIVNNKDAKLLYTFSGVDNSETYFRFKNNGATPIDDSSINMYTMIFTPYSGEEKHNKCSVKPLNINNSRYDGREMYSVNLGYHEKAVTSVEISFDNIGIYNLSDIEIICQPLDSYQSQLDSLKSIEINDFTVATDRIKTDITCDEDKIICLSVPYSSGWSAYVDGEKAELLQANTMMSALTVSKGEHEILLTYKTPYLNYGILLSAAGVLSFAAMFAVTEHKNKKRKSN